MARTARPEVDQSQLNLSPAAIQRLFTDLSAVLASPEVKADQEMSEFWGAKVQEIQSMYADALALPAGI